VARPIQKITIIGRDADAWISALMLKLHLAKTSVQVQLVELPSHLHERDFFSVLPTQRNLHELMGLQDERALLKTSKGLPVLAQRFSSWSGAAAPFLHAYDTFGVSISGVEFIQCWLKARSQGMNVAVEEFSVGAAAAKQGKFLAFEEAQGPLAQATYGYHLGALEYLRAIGRLALKAGVTHIRGDINKVNQAEGTISSVELVDGQIIESDLFIDASGAEGALIGSLPGSEYESWGHLFPCDRMITASAPLLSPFPSFSQNQAFAEGWMGLYPLLNRTGVRALYSSSMTNAADVAEKACVLSGIKLRDIIDVPVKTGMHKSPWVGNCIALGDSAASLDYMDATQMHMLHVGLTLLRVLLPVDSEQMPESTTFNQRFRAHAEDVRNFQLAHYRLNKRYGELFWDRARQGEIPQELREKLNLFSSRGKVAMRHNQTFQESNWTALFLGHGVTPSSYSPMVDNISEQELMNVFQRLLRHIATTVSGMPDMQTHVEINFDSSDNIYGL
jgi:tryptophan halogenase